MKVLLFCLFFCLVSAQNDPTQDVVVPNGDDVDDDPAKEAVVQHPVTVSISAPKPMTTRPPMAPLKTRVVVVHNNMVPVPIECFQPPDSGTCSKDMARVYYDHETRTCKPFSYTGCGGNANRFQSIKNCYRICHPYRYKIRPKVANKAKEQQMKVRVVPAKQDNSLANAFLAQNQAAMARSLLQAQQGQMAARARSLYGSPYGNGGYGSPYNSPYGRQMPTGQVTPLTQRHVVMTPGGPVVKNSQVGSGSPVPGNTGQLSNVGK